MAAVCAWCGRSEEELPIDWVSSVELQALRYYCPSCARQHLRAIEGRLDQEWW